MKIFLMNKITGKKQVICQTLFYQIKNFADMIKYEYYEC